MPGGALQAEMLRYLPLPMPVPVVPACLLRESPGLLRVTFTTTPPQLPPCTGQVLDPGRLHVNELGQTKCWPPTVASVAWHDCKDASLPLDCSSWGTSSLKPF